MKNANPVSLLFACLALLLVACSPTPPAKSAEPKTVADWFVVKVGDQPVRLQLAVLLPEMEHGLMDRRNLGRDEGMLFVYRAPQSLSFWMRHTPTPLDVGYLSSTGELAEIHPLLPFDETPVKSRSDRVQFALEVSQGWFRERGVKLGAQMDLKAVAAALKERGFEPRKFGLEP